MIITIGAWLMTALIRWMINKNSTVNPVLDDKSLSGLVGTLFQTTIDIGILVPYFLLTMFFLGVFLLAQFSFWVVGIRRLWRTRKLVGSK